MATSIAECTASTSIVALPVSAHMTALSVKMMAFPPRPIESAAFAPSGAPDGEAAAEDEDDRAEADDAYSIDGRDVAADAEAVRIHACIAAANSDH